MWVGMSPIRDSLCSVCIQVVVTLGRMERGYLPGCVKLATDPAGEVGTQSKKNKKNNNFYRVLCNPWRDYPFHNSLRSVHIWALRKEVTRRDWGLELWRVVLSWHKDSTSRGHLIMSVATCT